MCVSVWVCLCLYVNMLQNVVIMIVFCLSLNSKIVGFFTLKSLEKLMKTDASATYKMDVTFFLMQKFCCWKSIGLEQETFGLFKKMKTKLAALTTTTKSKYWNKTLYRRIKRKSNKKICIKMTNIRFYHFPFPIYSGRLMFSTELMCVTQ